MPTPQLFEWISKGTPMVDKWLTHGRIVDWCLKSKYEMRNLMINEVFD